LQHSFLTHDVKIAINSEGQNSKDATYKEGIDPPHVKISAQGPLPDVLRRMADIAEEFQTRFDPMWRDPGMEAVAKEQGFELSGTAGSRLDSDEMKKYKEKQEIEQKKQQQEIEEMDDKNSDIQAHATSHYGPTKSRGALRGNQRGGYVLRGSRSRGRGQFRGRGGYQPSFQQHQVVHNQHQHYPPPVPLGYPQNVPQSPYGGPVRQTYQQQGYTAPY